MWIFQEWDNDAETTIAPLFIHPVDDEDIDMALKLAQVCNALFLVDSGVGLCYSLSLSTACSSLHSYVIVDIMI